MADVPLPQFTDSVDLRYFVEPLGAPTHPKNYLDRFPDVLYNKSPDSHFMRFMYTLLGPVGVGWLTASLFQARLQLEEAGVKLFDLESFYGDPFSFGRILDEYYTADIGGLLPLSTWDIIRSQDESYRSRAIQFMNAARLGTSPEGMQLAASSGIGQEVEIVENYRYLFDLHSDDRVGLPYYGCSGSLNEFVVVPRAAISRSEVQVIDFSEASLPLDNQPFTLTFNGFSATLASNADAAAVQVALIALPSIGARDIHVTGGPAPAPFAITFVGSLSNQTLPTIQASFLDTSSGETITVPVQVSTGVINPSGETVVISDADRHHMQVALDYLRPVASYPTFHPAASTIGYQPWTSVIASSEYTKVTRYVTGNPNVNWPTADDTHWIQSAIEKEAPQLPDNLQHHYVGWHDVAEVTPYSDPALTDPAYGSDTGILGKYLSIHVGSFPEMTGVMPFFSQFDGDTSTIFGANRALAHSSESLTVSTMTDSGMAFINGIYPADSLSLQGVPTAQYHGPDFWSSAARASGAEILEIDLGTAQPVNFISMEVSAKPIDVFIAYDSLDIPGPTQTRSFVPVTGQFGFPASIFFDPTHTVQWQHFDLNFTDGLAMIFTRFIRLMFIRRGTSSGTGDFLYDTVHGIQTPWSIEVRNLRIGRIVAP